jgi:hypothetical protein
MFAGERLRKTHHFVHRQPKLWPPLVATIDRNARQALHVFDWRNDAQHIQLFRFEFLNQIIKDLTFENL